MSFLGVVSAIKTIFDVIKTIYNGIKMLFVGSVDWLAGKVKQLGPVATTMLAWFISKEKRAAYQRGRDETLEEVNKQQERVRNESNQQMLDADVPRTRRDTIDRLRNGTS